MSKLMGEWIQYSGKIGIVLENYRWGTPGLAASTKRYAARGIGTLDYPVRGGGDSTRAGVAITPALVHGAAVAEEEGSAQGGQALLHLLEIGLLH